MKLTIDDVRSRFIKHFDGETGSVYASPGRINLIGEHTDYNNGFVFPGAVEQGMIAEIKPNGTRNVRAYSIDLKDYVEFNLDDEQGPKATWARYIFGVCREMMALGVPAVLVCLHLQHLKVHTLSHSTIFGVKTKSKRWNSLA